MKKNYTLSEITKLHANVTAFINMGETLPVKVSYALTKAYRALQSELDLFNEQRKPILEKYAEKDADGEFVVENDSYKIADHEHFGKEINELLNVETEIEIPTIKIEALDGINLKAHELMLIDFMIEE